MLEKTIVLAKELKLENRIKCLVSDGLNNFDKSRIVMIRSKFSRARESASVL